uniref:JunD proto-oncogene, AP-1 transcription factor subunit n=1 Tax=Anas zonorhyncha TaxID=75864 RepID=A0A8B9V4H4_9AVES
METPFYHDDVLLSGLGSGFAPSSSGSSGLLLPFPGGSMMKKDALGLPLPEQVAAALKAPGATAVTAAAATAASTAGGGDAPTTGLLGSAELGLLKLASPELERLIIQSNGLVTTTPTSGQFLYPKAAASEEQEFAEGFVKALEDLHKQNQLGGGGGGGSGMARGGLRLLLCCAAALLAAGTGAPGTGWDWASRGSRLMGTPPRGTPAPGAGVCGGRGGRGAAGGLRAAGVPGGAGGLWGCPPLDLKGTRGGSAPGAWSGATPLGAGRGPSCWWGALGCRAPTQDTWLAPRSMLCHLPVSSSASLFPGRARPGGFWGPLFGVTPFGASSVLGAGLGWPHCSPCANSSGVGTGAATTALPWKCGLGCHQGWAGTVPCCQVPAEATAAPLCSSPPPSEASQA